MEEFGSYEYLKFSLIPVPNVMIIRAITTKSWWLTVQKSSCQTGLILLHIAQTKTTFHTTSCNFDVLWNVALVWPPCCIVFYRVVSCCMKFDRGQTFHQTNVVRYNISFVFRDVVWCCTRLATPCNFVVLCCTRVCAAEVIFPPHSFVDFVFENMFNRVVRNVAFVWPPLS